MSKLSDRLRFMRDEVERSKRWRNSENFDELWRRMIDMYRGRHWEGSSRNDRLVVNIAFATKNVIAPSVAINNPRFVVNARKPDNAPNAVVTEEVLNYLWRCHKYQDEVRLAVDDWICCGHGWVKAGYKFVKEPKAKSVGEPDTENTLDPGDDEGVDDREPIVGNVESELVITDDRPFVERISIFDMFVDPDARHPKEMRWIAQRTWRAVQDVKVDERYNTRARQAVSATSHSRWDTTDGDGRAGIDKPDQGAVSYCEVIEFYDLKRKEVATFALHSDGQNDGNPRGGSDMFLIKPAKIPYGFGQPFVMLRNYEVPDQFYPMGDLESMESLQLELNETRTQMLNHRKRFSRKWLYQRDSFDDEGIRALESDVDNTMVPVLAQENPANAVAPMPSIITPPDFYNQSALIEEDINTVTGVSDYMRGQPESAIRRTATEAAMIQDAANARARDKLAKVESFLAEVGERIVLLMQQFMSGEAVARITSVSGRAWVNYDADYLKGAYDFEIEGGSTEPRNESFRRQAALQLVDAMAPFVQAGVINPVALARYILQYGFSIKDPSLMLQPEQPGIEPGERGPEEAVAADYAGQGPPVGQMPMGSPPQEQMNGGGPQIPPELLQQMGM